MWGRSRGLLCLFLLASLWHGARAEPWTEVADPEPQPTGTFIPDVFSEVAADGYWASGSVVQGDGALRTGVLIRFDADGQQQARAFSELGGGSLLKRLADGGVLSADSRTTDAPFEYATDVCQINRLHADGRTQWQTVLEGAGSCLALDIDAAGEIWVATGDRMTRRIAQVQRLLDDGTVATRIAQEDPTQTLVAMHVDPAGAGVFVAGHRIDPNTRAARARIQRLRSDGSVDWLWQSSSSAMASSIKHLQVSASAGILAVGGRVVSGSPSALEKDWQAVGLSLRGVPRFDKKISFGKAVDLVGASTPDAAGVWLVLQWGNRSDGANGGKVAVARLSASGKLGSSHQIKDAQLCLCRIALRRDGGLWLLAFDKAPFIVGIDAKGRERARLAVFSQTALGLLTDDRALGVTGSGLLLPIGAARIGFGQPAEPWSQLAMPVRTLDPIEAVASDGAVAQWVDLPRPNESSVASALTFRSSDTDPVAWRIEFEFLGDVQLSVSNGMVCLAGHLRNRDIARDVLECRRRADGSLLWRDSRQTAQSEGIVRFQAISALEDGRAVALSSGRGSLLQWVIGSDGQVLSEQSRPLLGSAQQQMVVSHATFNAQGDVLLIGIDGNRGASVMRLDRDGQERFRVALNVVGAFEIDTNRLAFADDGGAIMYGDHVIARYSANGEPLWERSSWPVADLFVAGDVIASSQHPFDFGSPLNPGEWQVVVMDSASGIERWSLPLGAPLRGAVGTALLTPQRLAVLQTEHDHLRYRELDVASGTLLREQTDDCAGELCGCEHNACTPQRRGRAIGSSTVLPLQAVDGRLRVRLDNFQSDTGWGSSLLELADAGQDPPTVRADQDGVSGAWYVPWSGDHELVLDWNADARTLFATWLTFSPDDGTDPGALHRYTLQGVVTDPSADVAMDILSDDGATPRRVGSAQLHFESCERAQFRYRFDPDENDGLSGLVTVSRLAPEVACEGSPAGAITATTPESSGAESGVP